MSGLLQVLVLLGSADPVRAQTILPGRPEDNGLRNPGATTYVNAGQSVNNGHTESLGIALARNGNVMLGWEDDGDGLADLEAAWTLYGSDGRRLTPLTLIKSVDPGFAGQEILLDCLSYYRADGSAVPPRTAWGPKLKANLFGDGLGLGGTAFELGREVVELGDYQDNGDWPAVQLLSDDGASRGIVSGLSAGYAARPGDIRIGDWDYLSNGRIVVAGESRQAADLTELYGGTDAQTHVIVRVVDAAGSEVGPPRLASRAAVRTEMWHGLGVTAGGFAVRFVAGGVGMIRLFDNSGVPVSDDLDLGVLAGNPIAGFGGRGEATGFHGNGVDAYALAVAGETAGVKQVWVTVLNSDGTRRWSRSVADDLVLRGPGRCDVAIDELGRVVVVFDDPAGTGGNARQVMGRLFDSDGRPLGGTFYVSEQEPPKPATAEGRNPRVTFRSGRVAVTWESRTGSGGGVPVVALRQFEVPRPVVAGTDSEGLVLAFESSHNYPDDSVMALHAVFGTALKQLSGAVLTNGTFRVRYSNGEVNGPGIAGAELINQDREVRLRLAAPFLTDVQYTLSVTGLLSGEGKLLPPAQVEIIHEIIGNDAGPLVIRRTNDQVVISYSGTLESADGVAGPYTAVPGGPTSPYRKQPGQRPAEFFRARLSGHAQLAGSTTSQGMATGYSYSGKTGRRFAPVAKAAAGYFTAREEAGKSYRWYFLDRLEPGATGCTAVPATITATNAAFVPGLQVVWVPGCQFDHNTPPVRDTRTDAAAPGYFVLPTANTGETYLVRVPN